MTHRPPVFHALTATAQEWRRVAELLPLACVPLGNIRFHGHHLPRGTDPLITTAVCERLLHRFGGMLFPPMPWPEDGCEDPDGRMNRTVRDLADAGFQLVVFVGPPCQHPEGGPGVIAVDIPVEATRTPRVIQATVRELLGPHGAPERGSTLETSLMMRLYPDLVRLPALDDPRYGTEGIIGPAPQATASPQLGREWFDAALDTLAAMVEEARAGRDLKPAWYYAQKHGDMLP